MENRTPRMKTGRVITQVFVMIFLLHNVNSARTMEKDTAANAAGPTKGGPVTVKELGPDKVLVDNGIIGVTFSKPSGIINGIRYGGFANVLNERIPRCGYWDLVWYEPGQKSQIDFLPGTKFEIVTQTPEMVELSFSRQWDKSQRATVVPLNSDKRFIIRSGVAGMYMYGVLERLPGWPEVYMDQTRIAFKLNLTRFDYMAVSDDRQKTMALYSDRETKDGHSDPLDYPEAVHLKNPTNPKLKGEVDDKYMYSLENGENDVHGWISANPRAGFWLITPSNEFRSGGTVKQELSSHTGPTSLSMFSSLHYAGKDVDTTYKSKDPWKKVFGPVLLYLNTAPSNEAIWTDAKRQAATEAESWPYEFVKSEDYPLRAQRGTVKGQFFVMDKIVHKAQVPGALALIGLAPPGKAGSWQTEHKAYQFWTTADKTGMFTIPNVRPGTYNLNAWIPGFIGDYMLEKIIEIAPGKELNVGPIVYEPPRLGPTLWEIGVPDRSAKEFFAPNPDKSLMTKLSVGPSDVNTRFRQYGIWDEYTVKYPKEDLVFTAGVSDYKTDWFYAHVTRNLKPARGATTWKVIFNLKATSPGKYTLRIALASSSNAELQVRINAPTGKPIFTTGLLGKDNAIARHGIHGLYHLFEIPVLGNLLKVGENILFLTQTRITGEFAGLMYDYLRLEGPPGAA